MKRLGRMTVVTLLAIGWLASGQAPPGRVEIELWLALRGPLFEAFVKEVDEFNASQDKYWVNAMWKGTYPEVMALTIAAFAAGKAPHIVQIFEVGTGTMLAAKGAIYPVEDLLRDFGIPFDRNRFIPAVRGYYSFPDGRMASMPYNSSTAVLWYNKDAFRAAGLDPDRPPRTWAEVRAAAKQIVDTGAAKIGLSASWFTWTMLEQFAAIHNIPFATRANGFEGLDAELTLTHPLFVRHLQTLIDMQNEGSFTYGGRDALPDGLFPAGEAAMLIASSALRARIMREANFEWGVTYLPYYDDVVGAPRNSIIGGASLWVMRRPDATPEHYRAVAKYFEFIMRPENDAWRHMNTGYVCLTYDGLDYVRATGYYEENPGADIPTLQLALTDTTEHTRGIRLGNLPEIRVILYEEIEEAFLGKQSAQRALENAVRRGNAVLRAFEKLYR